MSVSLLELFRTLSAFAPVRKNLAEAPWEAYVDWAIGNGLAPLAAWALEYRLGQVGAPDWAKDRLLSVYQGTVNDNVMKLVGFKGTVGSLEGRRVVLLGGASFAESLYPHVAFRPVIDLDVLLARRDVEPFAAFLRRAEYKPEPGEAREGVTVLNDGRTTLSLHAGITFDAAEDEGLLRRALPMKVYGPSVFRLDLEDALLVQALNLARAGFDRPFIELVDLRELLLGAPFTGGAYSRPIEAEALRRRAKVWKVERSLWTALRLVARLFPETEAPAQPLLPELSLPVRELLERLVVTPLAQVGRTERFRGEDTLRQVLAGG